MALFPSKNPKDYARVLKFATKPKADELKAVAAVSGAGLTLVGVVGFTIYFLMSFLPM